MRRRILIPPVAIGTVAVWCWLLVRAAAFLAQASDAADGSVDADNDVRFAWLHVGVALVVLAAGIGGAIGLAIGRGWRRWLVQAWAMGFGVLLLVGDHAHVIVHAPTGMWSLLAFAGRSLGAGAPGSCRDAKWIGSSCSPPTHRPPASPWASSSTGLGG